MKKTDMPPKWQAHDAAVRPYLRVHRINNAASTIMSLAVTAALLFTATGRELEWLMNGHVRGLYTHWLAYFAILALAMGVLGFPFSFIGWRIERKFGLSKQKFGSWLQDQGKGLALGAVIGWIVLSAL